MFATISQLPEAPPVLKSVVAFVMIVVLVGYLLRLFIRRLREKRARSQDHLLSRKRGLDDRFRALDESELRRGRWGYEISGPCGCSFVVRGRRMAKNRCSPECTWLYDMRRLCSETYAFWATSYTGPSEPPHEELKVVPSWRVTAKEDREAA